MLRLPAVAGTFYPSDPDELLRLIHQYAQNEKAGERVRARACLVPHAGYVYSGRVAGAVFGRLRLPRKFLILGVRHRPPGEPLAILSEGTWRTPLGDARIDEDLATQIRKACPNVREDGVAHKTEHSLEVEIPFLQALGAGFSFVPVAIGGVGWLELRELGRAIGRALASLKEEVLIVASSDMNHYESDAVTRKKDEKAIACLLEMDAERLYRVCADERITMCGLGPAVVMLEAMKVLGAGTAELVRYRTSGDASGDFRRVVGYAGMIFQ